MILDKNINTFLKNNQSKRSTLCTYAIANKLQCYYVAKCFDSNCELFHYKWKFKSAV